MITDFLETPRPREDLSIALSVLREFKSHESAEEYFAIMFGAWAKLEQLEEFLEHLVEGKDLQPDTLAYMQREKA